MASWSASTEEEDLFTERDDLDFWSDPSFVEPFVLSALLDERTAPGAVALDLDLSFVLLPLLLPSFCLSRLPSVEATAPGVVAG